MKRIIILLLAMSLLAACGSKAKVHDSISKDVADDTKQVLNIYDSSIEEDRLFTDKETLTLEDYLLSYGARYKAEDHSLSLSEEERRLFILARNLIEAHPEGVLTASSVGYYENAKELIQRVIETGEI